MSFCAFPSVRRPPQRHPTMAINLNNLVEIEKHTDKMIYGLQQSNHATTPLHTTDIIASEYMYPSSTTPMESEHLSVNSSRDSLLSNDDLHSLGFRSHDDPDTPISSIASSPSTRKYPLASFGKPDLSSQIASKSKLEQSNAGKSSVSRRQETQPQESSLGKGNGSVPSHKHTTSESSAKLSKSLPPLPPQLNSRNLLQSNNSRESVAKKIAAMGSKGSKDGPRSVGVKRPHEARRAASADEGRKGTLTTLPSLKVEPSRKLETSRKALPTVPPKGVRPSRTKLPQDDKVKPPSRTSSPHSEVLFSIQDLQSSEQVINARILLPVAHVKQPIRSHTINKPSTGLNVLTAMTSKPIICENPFVDKSSDAGGRAGRLVQAEKVIPHSITPAKPAVDDTETGLPSVFTAQGKNKRPTPAAPLTFIHRACYQSHRHMNNSKNDIAQVPCMACQVDDKEIRWKCSWCCLRVCNRCMEVLEGIKDRDLGALLQARQKTGRANEPWHSTVWEGIPDGPSF
ncbi:hypothetical protein MMC32_006867 [Xylographa parallela]|nr:hypothetical protein [Xylographa parallela]